MRILPVVLFSAVLMSGLSACMKEAADPSTQKYADNDAEIKQYASEKKLAGTLTSSGLYYVITLPKPTARQATVNEELEFSYKATNLQGLLVDSSTAAAPVYYPLGTIRGLLPGLEQGLSLMREGEQATFLIPSYLGFNAEPKRNLPAFSVVRIDATLKKSRNENQQIEDFIAINKFAKIDSTATPGVRFILLSKPNPTGALPIAGQTVTVRYKGWALRNRTPFDSTKGTETASFDIGKVVKGFDAGLSRLRVGEKALFVFPSSLGYGIAGLIQGGAYLVPPHTPYRFEVELVSVR